MFSVEPGEGRREEDEDHPVKLDIDSVLNRDREEFGERSEDDDGSQCF